MINNSQHFGFVLHCHEKGSSRRFKRLNDDHQILFSSDLLNTTFAFRDLINITATVVEKSLSHTKVTYRKVRKAKFKKDYKNLNLTYVKTLLLLNSITFFC